MGLEQVVEEILSRGQSEAEEIRRATLAEREKILADARAEGAKLLERREREAKEAADRLRVQALARAELESKKVVLSAQKGLLDDVYNKVLDKLRTTPDRREWLQALLQSNAAEWRNGKVYANAQDAETVRKIVGASFAGTIDCVGGIVIESADGSHRTDLRFETLLADIWRDSIREVAEVLWPAP
ncbi:MAG TPA: V-type ATP synthase subunit E family protein [Thermoplasmata archaeon]|jgi:V/A-type H+-transporting ATPase subunit E|nr:V-type ATP synthase subunit E family protein [Thermoplasmata archaeon]